MVLLTFNQLWVASHCISLVCIEEHLLSSLLQRLSCDLISEKSIYLHHFWLELFDHQNVCGFLSVENTFNIK